MKKAIFALLAAIFLSSCATRFGLVDHSISIDNIGTEDVYDFQLSYGDRRFPSDPDENFRSRGGRQYLMNIPVPDVAVVKWRTKDGTQIEKSVETRSSVSGKKWFDGHGKLEFHVNGETLQVFLVRKLPNFKESRSRIY